MMFVKISYAFRYPIGLCVSYCSTRLLEIAEGRTYPFPMPITLVLSEDGILCPFYAVNQAQNIVQLTTPPTALPAGEFRPGSVVMPKATKAPAPAKSTTTAAAAETAKPNISLSVPPAATSTPAFGGPLKQVASTILVKPTPSPFGGGGGASPNTSFNMPSSKPPPVSLFGGSVVMPEETLAPLSPVKETPAPPPAQLPPQIPTQKQIPVAQKPVSAPTRPPAQHTTSENLSAKYRSAMVDEINAFNKELEMFRQKAQELNIHIGECRHL